MKTLIFAIMSQFLFCCSGSNVPVQIPMPSDLENADPLITELITNTSAAITVDPRSVDAWAMHASALLANAYYEESVLASKIALEIDNENRFPLRYRQAVALWRLNKQEEAITQLEQILIEEPKYDFGWRRLASWYLELGELQKAQNAILVAWELEPDRQGTLATLCLILMQQGDSEQAIAKLKPRLNKDNTPSYLYFLAAQAYRRLGETESMEKVAIKSKPLPKRWPDPWMNQIALLATGKRMLATNGLALLQTQGPKAALPVLAKALTADPGNSQIRAAYAMSLFSQKETDFALRILEDIPNQDEAVPEYWATYANIAVQQAKKDGREVWLPKAMDYFQKAETVGGGSINLYRSMARLAVAMNDLPSSITYYTKGAELLIQSGDLQSAKSFIGEGLIKNKNNEQLTNLYKSITEE